MGRVDRHVGELVDVAEGADRVGGALAVEPGRLEVEESHRPRQQQEEQVRQARTPPFLLVNQVPNGLSNPGQDICLSGRSIGCQVLASVELVTQRVLRDGVESVIARREQ